MKKGILLIGLFAAFSIFLFACDNDNTKSYKFSGTVELSQYPEGETLSLADIINNFNSRINFRAIVKDTSGTELTKVTVSWGADNISTSDPNIVYFPADGRRMIIDITDTGYQPGEKISAKVAYGGVESEAKTITFIQ